MEFKGAEWGKFLEASESYSSGAGYWNHSRKVSSKFALEAKIRQPGPHSGWGGGEEWLTRGNGMGRLASQWVKRDGASESGAVGRWGTEEHWRH